MAKIGLCTPVLRTLESSEELNEVLVKVLIRDGRRFAVLPSSQRDIVIVEEADLHPR
jgi:hypothetical protein